MSFSLIYKYDTMVKKYKLKEWGEFKDKNKKEVYISKNDVMVMYGEIMQDECIEGFSYHLEEIKKQESQEGQELNEHFGVTE